jgi:hypothetical protein
MPEVEHPVGKSWARRRPAVTVRELGDDETLTQYGQVRPDGDNFRGQPRFAQGETEVSMIAGRRTVVDAVGLIASHRAIKPDDAVRYFTVGVLREADYVVSHTPTGRNPDHVSVSAPEGHNAKDWWESQGEPMLELHTLDGTHGAKEGDDE